MSVDSSFLRVDLPNTILFNMIPAGGNKDKTPISAITNIYTSTAYKLPRMILGALIAPLGFGMFGSSVTAALIIMIIEIFIVGSDIQTVFQYEKMGNEKKITFPFYEANHVKTFEDHVSNIVEEYHRETSKNMNF